MPDEKYPGGPIPDLQPPVPPRQDKKRLVIGSIIIALMLIGFGIWEILHTKNNPAKTSNTTTVSATCPVTANATNNKPATLPSDWNWYENKDTGFKYAYPKNWTELTNQTNTGTQSYVASFTVGGSGANTMIALSPDCPGFKASLADINNGTFDTLDGPTTTKAIQHNQTSYSSLNHWSSDAGNQYKLVRYNVLSVGSIGAVVVSYSVVSGSQLCPDDKLAADGQAKCITQAVSDEVDKVISSLQKI